MNKSEQEKVCAVVVTFNRKDLLIECLDALRQQTRSVDAIYIIDNASTDTTPELLKQYGYIQTLPSLDISAHWETHTRYKQAPITATDGGGADGKGTDVYYVRMCENTGGAGGFHEGVKRGHEKGFDWLWLMDDDGSPEQECLRYLLSKKEKLNFLHALVLAKEDKKNLCFEVGGRKRKSRIKTESDAKRVATNGLIANMATPFNGTLISRLLVEKIGYPKAEMFIWGDEIEYHQRALASGLGVATVVDAVHYHPQTSRDTVVFVVPHYKIRLTYETSALKNYCKMRNHAYIHKRYSKKVLVAFFVSYSCYFLFHFRFRDYCFYLGATFDGLFNRWGKEKRFLTNPDEK